MGVIINEEGTIKEIASYGGPLLDFFNTYFDGTVTKRYTYSVYHNQTDGFSINGAGTKISLPLDVAPSDVKYIIFTYKYSKITEDGHFMLGPGIVFLRHKAVTTEYFTLTEKIRMTSAASADANPYLSYGVTPVYSLTQSTRSGDGTVPSSFYINLANRNSDYSYRTVLYTEFGYTEIKMHVFCV